MVANARRVLKHWIRLESFSGEKNNCCKNTYYENNLVFNIEYIYRFRFLLSPSVSCNDRGFRQLGQTNWDSDIQLDPHQSTTYWKVITDMYTLVNNNCKKTKELLVGVHSIKVCNSMPKSGLVPTYSVIKNKWYNPISILCNCCVFRNKWFLLYQAAPSLRFEQQREIFRFHSHTWFLAVTTKIKWCR